MTLYFFDERDGDVLVTDDMGLEFADFEAMKIQAARGLAELARDVLPGTSNRTLATEVRDADGPVLKAVLTFEMVDLKPV